MNRFKLKVFLKLICSRNLENNKLLDFAQISIFQSFAHKFVWNIEFQMGLKFVGYNLTQLIQMRKQQMRTYDEQNQNHIANFGMSSTIV
jgi:hypothetical protein